MAAFQLHPQHLCDALPPAEVQGGGDGVTSGTGTSVLLPVAARAGHKDQHPRRGRVIGCATPVLCTFGVLTCGWPACVSGRG